MSDQQPTNRPTGKHPADFAALDQLTQQLKTLDLSQRSRIRQPLRERLLRAARQPNRKTQGANTMNGRTIFRKPSLALAGLALALILGLLALPPVQAFARQILAQVGVFDITDQKIDLGIDSPPSDPLEPTASPIPGNSYAVMSAEEAAEKAGFSLYQAGYMTAGYQMNGRLVSPVQDGTGVTTFFSKPGKTGLDFQYLSVSQTRYQEGAQPQEFHVGDAPLEKLSLRGQEAVWVEGVEMGARSAPDGGTVVVPMNVLMWEENGFTFMLTGSDLPQAEALKIAESLH